VDMTDNRESSPGLRIVTFNLLDDQTHWPQRAPLIVDGLRALAPDVIALQEAHLPTDNASWIAEQLGGFAVFLCAKDGLRGLREGEAILSRLPATDHQRLSFGRQGRVAHRMQVEHEGTAWTICNTHLYFSAFDDVTRVQQVRRLRRWLPEGQPTVVCGDFNAEPGYRSSAEMRKRFRSAYAVAHGAEPPFTCPTPLHRGPGFRHSVRRLALGFLGRTLRRGQPVWRGTIDYIYVSDEVHVAKAALVLDSPSPDSPRIYPSDHVGILAELQLQGHDPSAGEKA
jgi:endonuclease/exonuclease/phosphatase family metal-dependent hydrolase